MCAVNWVTTFDPLLNVPIFLHHVRHPPWTWPGAAGRRAAVERDRLSQPLSTWTSLPDRRGPYLRRIVEANFFRKQQHPESCATRSVSGGVWLFGQTVVDVLRIRKHVPRRGRFS